MPRRSPVAVIALAALAGALLLAASPAGAQPAAPARERAAAEAAADAGAIRAGGLAGAEFAGGDTGFTLRLDAEKDVMPVGPRVRLLALGSAGYTRFSDERRAGGARVDVGTDVLRAVPAARLALPLAPGVGAYGDAGIGLHFARTTVETRNAAGTFDDDSSTLGVNLRAAAGGWFEATPRLRVVAELGLNRYFGDFSETTTTLLLGAMLRL